MSFSWLQSAIQNRLIVVSLDFFVLKFWNVRTHYFSLLHRIHFFIRSSAGLSASLLFSIKVDFVGSSDSVLFYLSP